MNTVHDTTNAAKDKAAEVGSQVTDQAKSQVDTRTTQAGDAIQDKAEGLHQMSDQLRDSGQDAFAQLTEKVATLTEDAARYLRSADADSILADVEGYARKSPWAVAAGGALLGFAASRLVKAGTDRRSSSTSMGRYSTGSPESIDLTGGYGAGTSYGAGYDDGAGLTSGYAAGTSTGYGSDLGTDYATGTSTGSGYAGGTTDLTTGYEPLGSDIPSENPVPETDPAPLGDPEPYPTPSTQPGTGSYTDGNR